MQGIYRHSRHAPLHLGAEENLSLMCSSKKRMKYNHLKGHVGITSTVNEWVSITTPKFVDVI